jgi:hypothetical protein
MRGLAHRRQGPHQAKQTAARSPSPHEIFVDRLMRSTSEWIGKTDDAKIPDYVRLRVFSRHNGICHISKRRIRPGEHWDCDHVTALCNGGEHRERNLAPALCEPHRRKTADDRAEKARVDRKSKYHLGITKPKRKMQSGGFAKSEPQRRASSPVNKWFGFRMFHED